MTLGNQGVQSYSVGGLSSGVRYYFKVRATNGCSFGEWSDQVGVITSGGAVGNSRSSEVVVDEKEAEVLEDALDEIIEEEENKQTVSSEVKNEVTIDNEKEKKLPKLNISLKVGFGALLAKVGRTAEEVKGGFGDVLFKTGEYFNEVSSSLGHTIVGFGYMLVEESTEIYDVVVKVESPTEARVSWKTNHPADGKINYGFDKTYPFSMYSGVRTTEHEFLLKDLQPSSTYLFEVMSQAKSYVYDANREFETPSSN